MASYKKEVSIGGKWAKGSELVNEKRAKIVSETEPMPSQFLNKDGSVKTQDVCKVRFENQPEPLNLSLNRATINALVEAYGEDSRLWIDKYLGVETERVKVAGKTAVALYLIPEGFERMDDENGYTIIVRKGSGQSSNAWDGEGIPTINPPEPVEGIGGPVPF
jgi:hypothetical protein